jgi:hypothetical protein
MGAILTAMPARDFHAEAKGRLGAGHSRGLCCGSKYATYRHKPLLAS